MKNRLRSPQLKKWLFATAAVLLILVVLKDVVIEKIAESLATQALGAQVEIGRFSSSLIFQKIRIQDLTIKNPAGFPEEIFLSMPEITIQIDGWKALTGQWRFPMIVINLHQVVIIRNTEGKLNVDSLKVVQEQVAREKAAKDVPPAEKPPVNMDFAIDVLKLNIDRVIFKDSSKGDPPVIKVYDVGLKNKTIKNVNGAPQLVTLILVEALKPTAIRQAGVLAAASLLGVGFLPAAAFGVIVADDEAAAEIHLSKKRLMEESLKLVERLGKLKQQNADKGQISAKVYDCDIVIEVKEVSRSKSTVRIKARKFLLPKADIASGLLYQLEEQLQ